MEQKVSKESKSKNLPSQNLCKAFKEGWIKRGYKMIDLDNWVYCGGDGGRNESDLVYFMQNFPLSRKPRHENMCICTQEIKNNFYITNKDKSRIEIIGCDCADKFLKNGRKKTCSMCGDVHKNRLNNLCNECRKVEKQLDKNLDFGKYRYRTYRWVLENDEDYVLWLLDNVSNPKKKTLKFLKFVTEFYQPNGDSDGFDSILSSDEDY